MSNEFVNADDWGEEEEPRDTEVHKVTILVVDHDGLGAKGVKDEFENTSYANHCMNPKVKQVETRTVPYTDAHPLNSNLQEKHAPEYNRLFPETIHPDSAAIILNADGSYELALPKIGEDDPVQTHVLLTTALFDFFGELKPTERERIVTAFIKKTGLGTGGT